MIKSATGATLSASFSGVTSENAPQNAGFRYRVSGGEWHTVFTTDEVAGKTSGNYSASLSGLSANTPYEYQAIMDVVDPVSGDYVTIEGAIATFTTDSEGLVNGIGYLACYEVPAVSLSGTGTSEKETYDTARKWYRYNTTNSMRQVATHTYTLNNKEVRNYTVMLDGDKKAPIWCAFAMHASTWKDNDVGRNDDAWTYDPAFNPSWQQSGISGSYSKGHFVASNYRQTTSAQNKQTFYYSNQAPQWQTRFNDGIWNTLENKVKAAAPSGRDTLYVVVGILYEGTANYVSGVQIPSHFYKCLMRCSFDASGNMTSAKGTAYIFTNEEHANASLDDKDNNNNYIYKTTIDKIEERSGIDFFPRVPKSLQDTAEASSTLSL